MPVERTAAEIEAEILGPDNLDNGDEPIVDTSDDELDAPTVETNFDQEAGRKGWVPKHLYKGDPKKWVDSKTFIERGERFNKNLQRELADVKKQLENFQGTAKKFQKFHEETIARKDAEIADAIKALRIQRAEALRDGDSELSVDLEDKIDHLKEQQKDLKAVEKETAAAAEAPAAGRDIVLEEWIEDGNAWFRDEPKMREYAVSLGTQMRDAGVPVNGREFLDRVTEQMQRDFPRYFRKQTATARQSSVDSGDSGHSGASSAYSERDLPAEDRALMKEFIAQGMMTKEAFLKSYFSENPKRHSTKSK
jgi:hypothetical protein